MSDVGPYPVAARTVIRHIEQITGILTMSCRYVRVSRMAHVRGIRFRGFGGTAGPAGCASAGDSGPGMAGRKWFVYTTCEEPERVIGPV